MPDSEEKQKFNSDSRKILLGHIDPFTGKIVSRFVLTSVSCEPSQRKEYFEVSKSETKGKDVYEFL